MLGVSVPTFWLGIVVLLVFSVKLRLLPSGGMATIGAGFDLADRLWHVVGPAAVLATLEIAGWSRYLRSMLLEAMGQDYIRTARAKGLSEAGVVLRHGLRNALLPLITLLGLQGGRLVGGAMITETVFSWPGMGRLLVESLAARDYPVLMASFMLMAVLVLAGNLVGRSQLRGGRPPHPARLTWRAPTSAWTARAAQPAAPSRAGARRRAGACSARLRHDPVAAASAVFLVAGDAGRGARAGAGAP